MIGPVTDDAMNLLARAIEKAKSTDGEAIRKAMYEIDEHAGLIKTYKKPFGPNDHEGLAPDDYIMVKAVKECIGR